VVPVLRDLPLVQSLDLSLAYRYSDYAQSGGVSTYKASADWEVFDALRLRGGYQRAIRAPNVTELFNPQVAAAFLLGQEDPCNFDSVLRRGPNGAAIRSLCVAQGVPASIVDSYKSTFAGSQTIQGGNPNLEAEKADTYTAGLVLAPRLASPLLERLSFSVDYYNLRLEEAISSLSPDIVFRRCFNVDGDNPSYSPTDPNCQAIQRNPASGAPDRTLAPYFNLGAIKTSGIDFELDWGFPLSAFGLSDGAGRIDLNAVASHLIAFKVQPTSGSAFTDYTGTLGYAAADNNGAHPKWKANTSLTYTLDPASVALRWYYVGPMRDINGGPGLDPYSRFDLSGNVRVRDDLRISLGVSNLFDKKPLKTFGGLPGNTDSGTYDPLGRRYYISATLSFR
jgi:outer membrane receptor protein involved in Fe transport